MVSPPRRMRRTPGSHASSAAGPVGRFLVGSTPKVGEHNEEVLGGLLGYSEEEIATLYANDVIGNRNHYDTLSG